MAYIYVDNKKASDNQNNQDGSVANPYATIGQAAMTAKPGDTVIVKDGVYRERVCPEYGGEQGNQIIYKSEHYGKAVIKGSNIFTGIFEIFDKTADIYSIYLPREEYGQTFYVPLADTFTIPEHYADWQEEYRPKMVNGQISYGDRSMYPALCLGQVFINGESLYEKTNLKSLYAKENSWFFDKTDGMLYIRYKNINDNSNLIELTVRNRVFTPKKRGLGYITVDGFMISHCGNQFPASFWSNPENAQAGAVGTRSGHHWHICNNIITHIKTIGIDIGCECRDSDEDIHGGYPRVPINKIRNHVIENNRLYDCGACAITGLGHYNSVIANNYIEKSNSLNFSSPETAGIKFHYCYDADIYGNTVIDSNCDGIWLDNIYTGSKVHHNNLIRCGTSGIFLELGKGPVEVHNNFIYQTRRGLYAPDPRGSGIYAHDAEGIHAHDNVISECEEFGIYMRVVTNRWSGEDDDNPQKQAMNTANCVIENNTLNRNKSGEICFPAKGPRCYNNIIRNNVFIGDNEDIKMAISAYGSFNEDPAAMERKKTELIAWYEKRYGKKPRLWPNQDYFAGIFVSLKEWYDFYADEADENGN